jgi:hypothetical protein
MNNNDREQLRLLSVLHYIAASLAGFLVLMGTVYAGIGAAVLIGRLPSSGARAGWVILAFGAAIAGLGALTVTLNIVTARSLPRTRHRALCLVTACLNLVHVPLGTALGAFTLALLSRPSIRAAFSQGPAPASPALPAPSDWASRTSTG